MGKELKTPCGSVLTAGQMGKAGYFGCCHQDMEGIGVCIQGLGFILWVMRNHRKIYGKGMIEDLHFGKLILAAV